VNRQQPQRGRRRSTRRAERERRLTTETVEGTALALESVDNVEGGDGLALGVLSVGDSIANDALEEGLQDTTGLLVDHCDGVSIASARHQGKGDLLAEIRLTPPRRARRRMAGLVIPWMLSRKILR
jgi:hypothetical protein